MPIHQSPSQKKTVKRVMHEYKHGELKSARGSRKVKSRRQAVAIALSEAGASRYDTPKERRRNLSRTKATERRGETGQAAAEGGRRATRKSTARKSTARKSTARKSTGRKSAASRTTTRRKAVGRKSTPRRSTAAKRSPTQRKSTTARRSTVRRTTTRRNAASSRATTRRSMARRSAARRTTTQRRSAKSSSRTTARRWTASARKHTGGKTRAQLYREATRRKIPGRATMSKQQLERALRR